MHGRFGLVDGVRDSLISQRLRCWFRAPSRTCWSRRRAAHGAGFVAYDHHERLHSAIGFITPADMLAGRADAIWTVRHQQLDVARDIRRAKWQDTPTPSLERQSALARCS